MGDGAHRRVTVYYRGAYGPCTDVIRGVKSTTSDGSWFYVYAVDGTHKFKLDEVIKVSDQTDE